MYLLDFFRPDIKKAKIDTLKMIVELFDDFPEKSVDEFKVAIEKLIKREEIKCH